jgi:CHAT domain-containing protein
VAEALRAAQRDLKKNYRDTKYWGAFICQGDPGPLSVRTRNAVAGE